jgi:small-conductance mechanosensitive channel
MEEQASHFLGLLSLTSVFTLVRALLLMVAGFMLAWLARRMVSRLAVRRLGAGHSVLLQRLVYYSVVVIFMVSALRELGFNLGVLLGAASIVSVAVGFASQTSASNFISGLFLIAEQPFGIGDVITIDSTTGEVLSIDLLSVKLRTFDNLFVRIPNESLIKSQTTTLTRFPIRRFDLKVGIAYREDIARAREVLLKVADKNPLCLDEPAPQFIFLGFGTSSLDIQFSAWARRENYLKLRNSLQEQVKNAFDAEGIEIPFPHLSLYTGSATEPLPIRRVGEND